MIRPASVTPVVPPEEVARRIAEFRRAGYQYKTYAQVVYHAPFWACPWEGCGYLIKGIRFELQRQGTQEQQENWLKAFWLGPGVPARCPGCNRYVLFDVEGKEAVHDSTKLTAPPLPDDWHQIAYVLPAGR